MENLLMPKVDTHTHTLLSGHAFSTLLENVGAAKGKGLAGLCLTEHSCFTQYFLPHSQRMLGDVVDGIRIYKGIEADIMGYDGAIQVSEKYIGFLEFIIASIHDGFVMQIGNCAQNTNAYIGALRNPHVDMLGHADDPRVPCDFNAIAKEAAALGKLLEFNNNSLTPHRPNSKPSLVKYIEACAEHGVDVCISSDAHHAGMIGSVEPMMRLLTEMDFPSERIVNLTGERFETYISKRTERLNGI